MGYNYAEVREVFRIPSPRPAAAQRAICVLSPSADAPFLAYPAPLPSLVLIATASNAASSTSTAKLYESSATACARGTPLRVRDRPSAGGALLFSILGH
ncbi:hypothetical protein B0H19DRAFT_1197141 [Mycena capillaripes]|nr:hypothetical protein B0H19DRAFT_1197141 [Mycena capillaripes]